MNNGVGIRSLFQQIFPMQELNQVLLHCRQILYPLSHRGEVQKYVNEYDIPTDSKMVLWSLVLWLEINILTAGPHKHNNRIARGLLSTTVKALMKGGSHHRTPTPASPVTHPEGLRWVLRLTTFLEEIGQLLTWKEWWESPNCEMCSIAKSVAYWQQGVSRSNL